MKRIICIDPGHGGRDPGAINPRENYLPEKTIALRVAEIFAERLQTVTKRKYEVVMTRSTDRFLDLQRRCDISNNAKANLFVSIHCNAANAESARGIEVLHATGSRNGERAASLFLGEIARDFPSFRNRGLKPSVSTKYPRWIRVLHKTNAPAILVELGFLSNKEEGAVLNDPKSWQLYSNAMTRAVEAFFAPR